MDIALLEDSPPDARLLKLYFESVGHSCDVYESGQALIDEIQKSNYALIIVDWEISDISGDQVLHWVRQNIGWELPVIFVTGRDATEDIVAMLEAGADDYMIKPVNLNEMLARITALVRRSEKSDKNDKVVEIAPYALDFNAKRLLVSGEEIDLTPKEFALAGYLLSNIGQLIRREQLLQDIWGYGPDIQTRTIDIHISRLRKKLSLTEVSGWKLSSIYHQGYRLERV